MPKTLLIAEGIRVTFGLRRVLDIDRFELRDGERVGLVGENGAGKSTFLRVLAGKQEMDEGQISRFAPVSLLGQMDSADDRAGEVRDKKLRAQFHAPAASDTLSGGERTRRRIARALEQNAHILLADEPTSDLDAQGVETLERHLSRYEGALVIVSHDRALLNALCTSIAHLEDGRLRLYPGNYDQFRAQLERAREFEQFEYDQYRGEQARLRNAIQDRRERASQVRLPKRMGNSEARLHRRSATESQERINQMRKSLESRLAHLEEKQRPREDTVIHMRPGAFSPIGARFALEARGLNIAFDGRALLREAALALPTGSRSALIGPNGCGKTSLIRLLCAGGPGVRLNPQARVGLFGQDHEEVLDLQKSALENAARDAVCTEGDVRAILARLNLRGDDVFKTTGSLSGGERAKVALARLLTGGVNLLILDEPTNHLDIFALEALEGMLRDYAGTLLVVSHDRSFIRGVATRLIFFENQKLKTFEGGVEQYEKRNDAPDAGRLDRMALEMRMAQLAGRLSKPAKGDDVEALNSQYLALAAQLRALDGR